MKAMILAAGVGNRLRPLTDSTPKALVEVNGKSMLEIVLRRLIQAGCDAVVINLHHLAGQVIAFLEKKKYFGIRVEISHEAELLDTGGGLKKVAFFFDEKKPFILHNVDVLSDIDLHQMLLFHKEGSALATLAVQTRSSSRYFLFDKVGRLCGWESTTESRKQWSGLPFEEAERLAFCGVHIISPAIFPLMQESGVFSINQVYLRLAGNGEKIQAFRADAYYWRDMGRLRTLELARQEAIDRRL